MAEVSENVGRLLDELGEYEEAIKKMRERAARAEADLEARTRKLDAEFEKQWERYEKRVSEHDARLEGIQKRIEENWDARLKALNERCAQFEMKLDGLLGKVGERALGSVVSMEQLTANAVADVQRALEDATGKAKGLSGRFDEAYERWEAKANDRLDSDLAGLRGAVDAVIAGVKQWTIDSQVQIAGFTERIGSDLGGAAGAVADVQRALEDATGKAKGLSGRFDEAYERWEAKANDRLDSDLAGLRGAVDAVIAGVKQWTIDSQVQIAGFTERIGSDLGGAAGAVADVQRALEDATGKAKGLSARFGEAYERWEAKANDRLDSDLAGLRGAVDAAIVGLKQFTIDSQVQIAGFTDRIGRDLAGTTGAVADVQRALEDATGKASRLSHRFGEAYERWEAKASERLETNLSDLRDAVDAAMVGLKQWAIDSQVQIAGYADGIGRDLAGAAAAVIDGREACRAATDEAKRTTKAVQDGRADFAASLRDLNHHIGKKAAIVVEANRVLEQAKQGLALAEERLRGAVGTLDASVRLDDVASELKGLVDALGPLLDPARFARLEDVGELTKLLHGETRNYVAMGRELLKQLDDLAHPTERAAQELQDLVAAIGASIPTPTGPALDLARREVASSREFRAKLGEDLADLRQMLNSLNEKVQGAVNTEEVAALRSDLLKYIQNLSGQIERTIKGKRCLFLKG